MDFFIEATRDNAERVHAALAEFGYDMSQVSVEDLLTKKLLIRQYAMAADIHPFVTGIDFASVWSRRVADRIGETPAPFASLEDLITMKEAAGRPKDQEDLRALRRLRPTP